MELLFNKNKYKKYGGPKEINNRFFVSKECEFVFTEVPKVGISTTKRTLAEKITNKKVDYNVHDREKFILKSPDFYGLNENNFNSYFKFTFVRNPFTRILSGYLDKVIKNPGIELNKILSFANFPQNYNLTFQEFLKILEKMDWKTIDSHFRPQHIILCLPVIQYDFIGRFENFEEDLHILISKLFKENTTDEIKTVNHHQTGASSADLIEKYYDEEAIDLVKKIYAQDFLYLDYSVDINKKSF